MSEAQPTLTAHTASPRKTRFLGLDFDDLDQNGALREIRNLEAQNGFFYVVTPNVDHIVQLHEADDPILSDAYQNADLTVCDSRILASLARRVDIALAAVPGSDLTREYLRSGPKGARLAMIGGDPAIQRQIEERYPDFDWLFHQPPMGVRRDPGARLKIAEFVEKADANIIFFAIGAPQSEITCREISRRGKASGVALCIGASLEFLVGAKKRAPQFMQTMGLEWLYRLMSEPGRLWRRYLVEGPKIFAIWWRWQSDRRASGRGKSDQK